jgi:hypothetical protein
MARYRAKAQLYVGNRLIAPGDIFSSDLEPGSQWEAVDENGKPLAAASDRNAVDIPEGWRDLNPEQRINLARRLGAPVKGTKAADADRLIEAEVSRRAQPKPDTDKKDV